jgi:hypothetical protein
VPGVVRVFLYSEPTFLGTVAVSASGSIVVEIPADTPAGTHTLELQDAQGQVLGSVAIEVTGTGADGLSATGPEGIAAMIAIATALLAAGAITLRHRRRIARSVNVP